MSKKINESLSKEFRLGQVGVNNQGLKMTIIAYRKAIDIDVQFEDGTIVENRIYGNFLKGTIANPNYRSILIIDRIGETNINNQGFKMTIIKYRGAKDIDIQFEDGTIVENKQYNHFLKGQIAYPMENRIGETKKNNQGLKMTIIAYRNNHDIDVQFEDGTIVENRTYDNFLRGKMAYPSENRIGETKKNNQDLIMTIIAYRNSNDLDIQFEDGTIVENRTYDNFLKGQIAYPMEKRIGETNINNQGLKMTIIAYRGCKDIDVQFEDGTIVENRAYDEFLKGKIANPNVLSDGISIPEKFMWNVLKELNIEFKTQLNKRDFEWCQNYRYDFYIPSLNMVIETHGGQHYENSGRSRRTLEEEQLNDRLKKELALNNNIKNYVVVDCRKSELEWLKENTTKELDRYFDLSNIDWNLVWNSSLKNLVYETKRLIEEGKTNKQIAEILGINEVTVIAYKKQLGIKTKYEIKQENLLRTKELVQQGKSIKEIAEMLDIGKSTVERYKRELREKN